MIARQLTASRCPRPCTASYQYAQTGADARRHHLSNSSGTKNVTSKKDLAICDRLQAGYQAQQSGFARPRRSQQGNDLVGREV